MSSVYTPSPLLLPGPPWPVAPSSLTREHLGFLTQSLSYSCIPSTVKSDPSSRGPKFSKVISHSGQKTESLRGYGTSSIASNICLLLSSAWVALAPGYHLNMPGTLLPLCPISWQLPLTPSKSVPSSRDPPHQPTWIHKPTTVPLSFLFTS